MQLNCRRVQAVPAAHEGTVFAPHLPCCGPPQPFCGRREQVMSKGMDRKKETKKKAAKTPQEKRAAKHEKKAAKPFAPT